jgi:O-antigen/teichoic acid export membrane protein
LAVLGYVVTRSYNLYFAERARVRHEIGVYSIQQVTGPALGFLIGLLLIHVFGQDPEWPIAGYAIAQFAAMVIVLPMMRFGWSLWPVDRTILRQALSYGVPLVLGGGLSWVSINASRFIVSDMMGVAAAGLFAVGYGLGFRASLVAAMMVTASAFPLAVRTMQERGAERAMRQLADNGALLAAILLPSVAGIYMLREEIVHLLIAPNFQAATLAILPLATLSGAIRNFRAHFADQVFLLHQRTRLMIVINAVEALLTVAASILFISWWGLPGAVIASTLAAAVAATVSFTTGAIMFRLRPPLLHFFKIAAATAAMMLVLHGLKKDGGSVLLALHIGLGASVYAVALALLYAPVLKGLLSRRARPA